MNIRSTFALGLLLCGMAASAGTYLAMQGTSSTCAVSVQPSRASGPDGNFLGGRDPSYVGNPKY